MLNKIKIFSELNIFCINYFEICVDYKKKLWKILRELKIEKKRK